MILCNYSHRVLHISTGIHDLGPINWELALCLLLAWFCFFLVLLPGIKTFGKVSTNIFPLHNLFLLDFKFIFVWCHSRAICWLFRLLNARCQSQLLFVSVFTLQKMAVQVNVIYFPRVGTDLTINYIIIYLWLYFDYF